MRLAGWVVLLTFCGCSNSGSNGSSNSQGPVDVAVKVSRATTWPLTPEQASSLTADNLSALATIGVTLRDRTLVFAEVPLVGYWIEVGGVRHMTDDNAVVMLHGSRDDVASVYEDFASTNVIGTFRIGDAVGKGSPAPVSLPVELPAPGAMNDDELKAMALHGLQAQGAAADEGCPERDLTHCAPGDNTMGCCVDYNNPAGTGKAYYRDVSLLCDAVGVANYIQSTCFAWTAASVCIDEKAFNRGPSCWEHHKWRNCQNLSLTDFSNTVTGKSVIKPGESTTIKVRNNLPANDTLLVVSTAIDDKGKLSNPTGGAALTGSGTEYVLQHYNDAAMQHVIETTITYTAPPKSALPPLCTTVDVNIGAAARTLVGVEALPTLQHEIAMLKIDCGSNQAPPLHLHWKQNANPMHPNRMMSLFDVTADVDLMPTNMDPVTVNYLPVGGTVTFSYVPYDPPMSDPCTYSATVAPVMLPEPPTEPAFLSISTKAPGLLFAVGNLITDVVTTRECPDGMGGTKTDMQTSTDVFGYMNLTGPTGLGEIGSLETLASMSLGGTEGDPSMGATVEWMLSAR
jgi:hypothetical protein